jgi:hypothetical protein
MTETGAPRIAFVTAVLGDGRLRDFDAIQVQQTG